MFDREGFQLAGSFVGGDDHTFGDNLVLSGMHDRVAYSFGQYHYETDGFRPNADIEHDVYYGYMQGQIRPTFFLQAAFQKRETEQGDLRLNFDPSNFNQGFRLRSETTTPQIGLRVDLGSRSTLLLAARGIDRSARQSIPFELPPGIPGPPLVILEKLEADGQQAFARLIHDGDELRHNLGVDTHALDLCSKEFELGLGDPCSGSSSRDRSSYASYYYYADFEVGRQLHWTLGLSYVMLDDEFLVLDEELVDPKLGLRWRLTPSHELRLALTRGIKPLEVADLRLEPAVVAGFNQLHDDFSGTRYVNVGIAYDWKISAQTRTGVQLFIRELDEIVKLEGDETREESLQEAVLDGYWSRILRPGLSLAIEPLYERLERDENGSVLGTVFPHRLETLALPIGAHFAHPNGFFMRSQLSLVYQSIENVGIIDSDTEVVSITEKDNEYFTSLDLSLGMRLPTRRATFRLDVNNLFDETFLFQGQRFRTTEPSSPRFAPGRTIVGRVSFSFR